MNIETQGRLLKVHIEDAALHARLLDMSAFAYELTYTDADGRPAAWDVFFNDNSTACAKGLLRILNADNER
jgi:hypothetical protein